MMEPNFDFVRYFLPLPDGRQVEASMFIGGGRREERTVRLQATLVDSRTGVILKASPRRSFLYDAATIDNDREFFTAEFEQLIGFELPANPFAAGYRVQS